MANTESLRFNGISSIAVDKPTRSMLKQLAGDTPVSHYVKALAERELAKTGKGRALPGSERDVSAASLPAISESISKLSKAVMLVLGLESAQGKASRYDKLIRDVLEESAFLGITPPWDDIVEMRAELAGKEVKSLDMFATGKANSNKGDAPL